MLAVPIEQKALVYSFSTVDPNLEDVERMITAIELLALLDQSPEASLSLYLMPDDPIAIHSSGIWLPGLVITPGATPTPSCNPALEDCSIMMTPVVSGNDLLTITPAPTEVPLNEND